MLNDVIAFTSFSTDKLFESRAFYADVLGMEVELVKDRFLHVHLHHGEPVVIYQKENHQPANFTVLNFQVKDIAALVNELTSRGVTFLQFEKPIKTDPSGISWDDDGSHIAWFRDPGGNILALIEN